MSKYSKNLAKPISRFAPSHNKVLNQSHESRSWLERRNEPLHLEQWSLYTNQVSLNKPESAHTTGNHLFSAIAKLRFEYLVYNCIKNTKTIFICIPIILYPSVMILFFTAFLSGTRFETMRKSISMPESF